MFSSSEVAELLNKSQFNKFTAAGGFELCVLVEIYSESTLKCIKMHALNTARNE